MRVLWISHVYPRDTEDLQGLFLHRLARELPRRNIELRVVSPLAPDTPPESLLDGVLVRRFRYATGEDQSLAYTGEMHRVALRHPGRFVRFVRQMVRAALREAEEYRPDIIHGHWWFPGGLASRRTVSRLRVPFVLSVHGTDVRLLRKSIIPWPIARWVFGGADCVLPVSESLRRDLLGLRLPLGSDSVLPMPADDLLFRPAPLPEGAVSFVVPARLAAQKRVDLAIRAVAWARERGTRTALHLVGEGEKRRELQALVERLGLADLVTFHGLVPQARLYELLIASRAVVLPSENEGYGLVLVEGALCERASIGVRSGATEEFIVPGETGLLVNPGDVEGLGRALVELATDAGLAETLGRNARHGAQGRTSGPLADRLVGIYRELAGSGGPGSARGSRIP